MSENRHTVLLIARNFPPLIGGIEQLMHATQQVLSDSHDVVLLGPRGSESNASGAMAVCVLPAALYWFLPMATLLLPYLCLRYRPDVVITSNGLMAPLGRLAATLTGARHINFLHGLDITTTHALYQNLFLPCSRRASFNVVNSRNTERLALAADIPSASLTVIHPCIREPMDERDMPEALTNSGAYLLYAGRVVPRKGLYEFLAHCGEWLRSTQVRLVVAGDAPHLSAADDAAGEYMQRVLALVRASGLEDFVLFLGRISDAQLAACMDGAAVHVMPLLEVSGDVEGFGMVAVEAATYGTPTVAFDCGGVADAVGIAGTLVAAGDYQEFYSAIEAQLRFPIDAQVCRQWSKQFNPGPFSARLLELLR